MYPWLIRMEFNFNRKIWLDADRLQDKTEMAKYMHELFPDQQYFGNNLDALQDILQEVNEDTDILLTKDCVEKICKSKYAFTVLRVLGKVADENPHIHILFRE